MKLKDGEPCNHPGCLHHLSHPCEGCGRIGGRYVTEWERLGQAVREFAQAVNECPVFWWPVKKLNDVFRYVGRFEGRFPATTALLMIVFVIIIAIGAFFAAVLWCGIFQ